MRLIAIVTSAIAALALTSVPAQASSATRGSVRLTTTTPTRGARVYATGTISPARTSRRVYLQRYASHRWRTVSSTRTRRGRFSLRVPTTSTGRYSYRLSIAAGSGAGSAHTGTIRVSVKAPLVSNPQAYTLLPTRTKYVARWDPCTRIGYRVNARSGGPGATTDAINAVKQVAAATGLTFVYRGSTTIVPGPDAWNYPSDTQLVIAWAAPGVSKYLPGPSSTSTAGVGGPSWHAPVKDVRGRAWAQIDQGFVVLNANMKLPGGFGAGHRTGWAGTRGQVLMHELGHAVGLTHPRIADRTEIMYPTMQRRVARWGAGDRAGLRYLGRSQGCLVH